jgi:hypothetical protein
MKEKRKKEKEFGRWNDVYRIVKPRMKWQQQQKR